MPCSLYVCATFSLQHEKICVVPSGQSTMKNAYHIISQPTKLISIKFAWIIVDTTSMIFLLENHYIFWPHRSSSVGTLTRNFVIELWYCLKCYIFWDTMPCSLLIVKWRFGGICRLQLQGQRISQARSQREAGSKQSFTLVYCMAYSLTLKMQTACSSEVDFQWNSS
jgi:hypothetical protein